MDQKVDKTTFLSCIISEVTADCKERLGKLRKALYLTDGQAERIPAEKAGNDTEGGIDRVLFADIGEKMQERGSESCKMQERSRTVATATETTELPEGLRRKNKPELKRLSAMHGR